MAPSISKALACFLAAFAALFWVLSPEATAATPPAGVFPESWLHAEGLDVRGRRLSHWSSLRDGESETRLSAAHFRARGLDVNAAYEKETGGMITFVEAGHRLIISIVSTPGGSAITLVSGSLSKEVAP